MEPVQLACVGFRRWAWVALNIGDAKNCPRRTMNVTRTCDAFPPQKRLVHTGG